MKRPRQSAVRQNAGPLALFSFVVNVTASFFRQFSRHISTWEKELNRRRQTLKPLENQGFFRLSLLYRNGTHTPRSCWQTTSTPWPWPRAWATATPPSRCKPTRTRCVAVTKTPPARYRPFLTAQAIPKAKIKGANAPSKPFLPPIFPQFSIHARQTWKNRANSTKKCKVFRKPCTIFWSR